MKQAILNITKNAVEAMPEGGQLTVKTYAVKERFYLEIKDTGMGFLETWMCLRCSKQQNRTAQVWGFLS